MSNKKTVLDLFAGVGGIAMACENAGMLVTKSIDFDQKCSETFNLNFYHDLIVDDISKLDPALLEDFDVLTAGFPCQPFSIAGYKKGFKDEGRGDLFFNIVDILKEKQPKAFMLENVKNLVSHNKGNTMKIIMENLKDAGYMVKFKVMNTMHYTSLPQNRERVFIVGFTDAGAFNAFEFPEKTNDDLSISSILESGDIDQKYFYDDKYKISEQIASEAVKTNTAYQWRRTYTRENKSGVLPTLTANMGTGGHNVPLILADKGVRKLTPRECFNAQGFPASYKLPKVADGHLYKQAGNSVSIPLVELVATKLKEALK